MIITKDIFESIVSTAVSSTDGIYEKLLPHFTSVEEQLTMELLGDELAADLTVVPALDRKVMELICLRTFAEQIPFLDLILTDTGFGIVSNQNLAPASADRVQKLLQRCTDAYEDTYDHVLYMLIGVPQWMDSEQAQTNISSVIFTAKHLRLYTGKAAAHRAQMRELRPLIYQAEEKVMEHLSADFYLSIIEVIRHGNPTRKQSFIIDSICKFVGFCVVKDFISAKAALHRVIAFAETHAKEPEFATYLASDIYKAKHLTPYENEKDHTTYFFGQ